MHAGRIHLCGGDLSFGRDPRGWGFSAQCRVPEFPPDQARPAAAARDGSSRRLHGPAPRCRRPADPGGEQPGLPGRGDVVSAGTGTATCLGRGAACGPHRDDRAADICRAGRPTRQSGRTSRRGGDEHEDVNRDSGSRRAEYLYRGLQREGRRLCEELKDLM